MKRKSIIISLAVAAALTASAVPAKRGFIPYTQPDGSVINVELRGDEFFHYFVTEDSVPLMRMGDGGLYYATADAADRVVNSGILARPAAERSATETAMVAAIERPTLLRAMVNDINLRGFRTPARAAERNDRGRARANAAAMGLPQSGMGKYADEFIAMGSPKALVVLVEYSDVKFNTPDAHGYFHGLLNTPGFSQHGATGSAAEYFEQNSAGNFTPQFDVFGPVTLPHKRAYYGSDYDENGRYQGQENAHYMVRDAVAALDATVNFSQYDTDGNGYVDNVFIIYAGVGEAMDQSVEESVWPHQWNYQYSGETPPRADGVILDHYACANEWLPEGRPTGVGTFIHEFSHVMGLPDLYNTENSYANYTPGAWSVLDYGPYNNDGCTPPNYSAYERNAMGWMVLEILDQEPRAVTLESIAESNKAYIIQTDALRDFFLIENRQLEGWDAYLPNSGMLVWHIDATESPYNGNVVNNTPTHQYVDLIEANNRRDNFDYDVMAGYSFPGTSDNTSLSFSTTPALRPWSGTNLGIDITDITETSDGLITFSVNGGDPLLGAPVAYSPEVMMDRTFEARWDAVDGATDYLLTVEGLYGSASAEYTCDFGSGNSITLPSGWTSSSTDCYKSTSTGYYGESAPAIKLGSAKGVSEHFVKTPDLDSDITSVSFWYRGASAGNGSTMQVFGHKGNNWVLLETLDIDEYVSKTAQTYVNEDIPAGVRAIKIVYKKAAGNLAVDDIAVTTGGQQYRALAGMDGVSTSGALSYMVTIPADTDVVRYSVKATDGENVSRASNVVTVHIGMLSVSGAVTGQTAVTVAGRTVTAAGDIAVYDLAGRAVISGNSTVTVPAAGAYVIVAGDAVTKAIIR